MDTEELSNQTALITGGTAGIGLACARLLAGEGASVIITGRDVQRGEAAAAEIGGNARFVQADLSDTDSVKSLVHQAGNVDILVNNAASFPAALTVDQELMSFEKTFDTNVRGSYFLAARPGARHARARPRQHHQHHQHGRLEGCSRCIRLQCLQGRRGIPHRAPGPPSSGRRGSGSTASPPVRRKPKASKRNGAKPMRNSAGRCR